MTPSLIILQGGEDVKKKTNRSLFESLLRLMKRRKILIIPWTANSSEKEIRYREIHRNYFLDVGFREIVFLERDDSEAEMEQKFSNSDVLYLPGGDPSILRKEIESRSLQARIAGFRGIIIGNSAGAIVLSKGGYGDGRFYEGFGLVNFRIKVHLNLELPSSSNNDGLPIIGIPENDWISVENPS